MPISLSGSLIITGSMTTSGTITAQTLVVQTITSSIVNITGSNIFGSQLTDRQTFTGSVNITGSQTVFGNVGIGTTSPTSLLEVQANQNAQTGIRVRNSTSGTGAQVEFGAYTNSGNGGFGKYSTGATPYKNIAAASTYVYNGTSGDIALLNDASAGNISFAAGAASTAQMFISASGNIGIGTTSPVQKFHVEGSTAIGTTGTENILILGRAINNAVSFQQAASLKLGRYQNAGGGYESYTRLDFALRDNSAASNYNTNTTVMTLTNAGNVGIGTTAPNMCISVIGSGSYTSGTIDVGEFADQISTSAKRGVVLGYYANGTSATAGTIRVPNNGSLLINSDGGNVGIGTTTPSSILDVRTGAGTSGSILSLQNTTAANASNIVPIRFYSGNTFGGLEQIAAIWGINPNAGANNGGTLVFATSANGTATTPAEKMRITSAGNVGIGTTPVGTPDTKLHLYDGTNPLSLKIQRTTVPVYFSDVQTAGTTAGAVWSHNIENTSNGSVSWSSVQNTSYAASAIILNSDTSNSYITFLTSGSVNAAPTERMRINGSGHVLIGQTSANGAANGIYLRSGVESGFTATADNVLQLDRLSNTGNIQTFYYAGSSVGYISTNGSTITFSGNALSDARYKENIQPIEAALSAINAIEFVTFNYKENNQQKSAGITAQQVQTVTKIADFVIGGESEEDYKAFDYNALIGYLGKSIQELSTKLDEATTRINALESK